MLQILALFVSILTLLMPAPTDTASVYAPDLYKDQRTLSLLQWHAVWVNGMDLLACAVTNTPDGTILSVDPKITPHCVASAPMQAP